MKQITPGAKLVLIGLIIGGLIGLYKVAEKNSWIPKSTKTNISTEAKEAMKSGAEVLKVGINTWGGYASGLYYNNGTEATTNSKFYKNENILVNFVVIDDFKTMRDAWKAGDIDVLGLATVDSLPTEIDALKEYKPKILIQTDWSRGGDAIVVKNGIKSPKDLVGKKVAFALGTPSHSLLLTWLTAGNVSYNDIIAIGTDSGILAKQEFINGAVDAAVVWSPDDEDCIKAVPGSKILFNTKQATNVIADIFIVKEETIKDKPELFKKFTSGWFKGTAEIYNSEINKSDAINIMAKSFNVSEDMSKLMINNVRLSTFKDNTFFFGLGNGTGVRGEELYNKMFRLFSTVSALNMPVRIPTWRDITYLSVLQELSFSGPGYEAEGTAKFTEATTAEKNAEAFADKPVSITYEIGSSALSDDGKIAIDLYFANTAKEFGNTRVRIEGNTDSTGNPDANKNLSYSRARSVANYLVQKYGFDKNRFVIIGNGQDKPVADNSTSEGRSKNRRTDFLLLK